MQITYTSYLGSLCNALFFVAGSSSAFHHVYEGTILGSRQPGATPAERALGETRASELNRVTSMFILRRTQEINTKYLPPKGRCYQILRSTPSIYRPKVRATKYCGQYQVSTAQRYVLPNIGVNTKYLPPEGTCYQTLGSTPSIYRPKVRATRYCGQHQVSTAQRYVLPNTGVHTEYLPPKGTCYQILRSTPSIYRPKVRATKHWRQVKALHSKPRDERGVACGVQSERLLLSILWIVVELVLFCRPSDLQVKLYKQLLNSRVIRRCIRWVGSSKICSQL